MKYIGKFAIKSKNVGGDRVKTICYVSEKGVVYIERLVLSNSKKIKFHKKLCTKFGKSLHYQYVGFKLPTLQAIHNATINILSENKIKIKDILI